jgi:hypothetical protein
MGFAVEVITWYGLPSLISCTSALDLSIVKVLSSRRGRVAISKHSQQANAPI